MILELVRLDTGAAQPINTCRLQKELVHLLLTILVLHVPPEQLYRLLHLFLTMKSVVNYVLLVNTILKLDQVIVKIVILARQALPDPHHRLPVLPLPRTRI